MRKNQSYIFILFIQLLISTVCLCSEARNFASLMAAYARKNTAEQTSSPITPYALYKNTFPEMVTQCKQLQLPKRKSKKITASVTGVLGSFIKNGIANFTSLTALLNNDLPREKGSNSARGNKCALISFRFIGQKKLTVKTGAIVTLLSTIMITLFYRNFKKEYGEGVLCTPFVLQLFIKGIIDEIKKQYCIKRLIEPLLFKRRGCWYSSLERELLEHILMLFTENNTVICSALKQNIVYREDHHDPVICYGSILDALFFRAAKDRDKCALKLFFKYDIHKNVDMRLRKVGTYCYYSSLAACIATEYERVLGEEVRCVKIILDNMPFKNNEQVEDFMHDIIKQGLYAVFHCCPNKLEKIIQEQNNALEIVSTSPKQCDFSIYFAQLKFRGEKIKFIKLALQYMTDLKNMNSYYNGVDINYFIQSKYVKGKNFVESIKPLFLRNDAWFSDSNQNLILFEATKYILDECWKNKNLAEYLEEFFHYIQLLLSYGIKIPDNNQIKQEISQSLYIEPSIKEKLDQDLSAMIQQELDFRKKFLRFDDQENRFELFRQILEHTSQPAIWMMRVIQLPQEKFKQIDTLFPYCANHFYELLQKPMWEKQYIHYVDSWKHLLIFLSKDNLYILHKNKKIIGKCIVKIFEYSYFFPSHDIAKIENFLTYCLAEDNPEIPFPDLCAQRDLGNIFHLYARSGLHNKTLTKIMEIAKTKHQEMPVLCALTQVFKKHEFIDKHTPLDLAWQEVLIAHKEERDRSRHEETISIMKSFTKEFTDTCYKTVLEYKKSPHIAYSSLEDKMTEIMIKTKKELMAS